MQKEYCNSIALTMILNGQRGISRAYQNYAYNDVYSSQSFDLLNDYIQEKIEVNESDLSILEDIAYALRNTSFGKVKKEAETLLNIVLKKVEEKRIFLNKLRDCNFAAFLLNNKKLARNLNPEEFLILKQTLQNDTIHSQKLKLRLLQQLQSYALLKYGELKKDRLALNANRNFLTAFNFNYQRTSNLPSHNVKINKVSPSKTSDVHKKNKFGSFFRNIKYKISKSLDNVRHNLKVFFYRHELKFAIGSFALAGLFGYKMYKNADYAPHFQNANFNYVSSVRAHNDTINNDTIKTADYTKEAILLKNSNSHSKIKKDIVSKTSITGDYFDTSLEIHLKSKEKVQSLYDKIDALAEDGKIKFDDGTNTKKYAHAFTMYNLIRPNSAENKIIQNLLNGGNENPELINRLVLKAKDTGTGVKPDNRSIKTSNFDNANFALQKQHLKNLKSLSL